MNNTSISKILWALSPAKFFFTLSVISLFTFSSCNKSSILGLEVQPPNDMINGDFQDTLTLLTRTVKEDSLKTSGQLVAVIGKLYDPVMGETNAGIYTQLRMIAGAPVFGKNPKCDSVRLTLMYKNSYGKKVRKQQVMSVYELTEDMGDILTTYYSDHKLNYNPADLANFTFTPRPTDSVYTDTSKIKRAPRLHVPLLKDFGQKILDKQGATELATNANFYQFMKGFKITTENTTGLAPEEGNLLLLDISASTLDIFYKYEKDTINHKDTTASYSFTFAAVTRYMKYDHDFTKGNADFQKQMVQSSPPLTNDVCYAQGLAGVKTRIKIPYLTQWGRKELIGINRAELIVKAISTTKDTLSIPPKLWLFGVMDDGKSSYVLPDQYDGDAYFDGYRKDDTDTTRNISTYHFTITRYLQQVISGRLGNNGLHLCVQDGNTSFYRILVGGGTPTLTGGGENKYQMKLNVTYTKLN